MKRPKKNWKYYFTQFKQITFQESNKFVIGYTIKPCIKQILNFEGLFKRKRTGQSIPEC